MSEPQNAPISVFKLAILLTVIGLFLVAGKHLLANEYGDAAGCAGSAVVIAFISEALFE